MWYKPEFFSNLRNGGDFFGDFALLILHLRKIIRKEEEKKKKEKKKPVKVSSRSGLVVGEGGRIGLPGEEEVGEKEGEGGGEERREVLEVDPRRFAEERSFLV